MDRREFLITGSAAAVVSLLPETQTFLPFGASAGARTFEVTTRIEVLKPSGPTRIWVPTALIAEAPFQKTLENSFHADGGTAQRVENKTDGLAMVVAEFGPEAKPVVTVNTRIETRPYAVDLSKPGVREKSNPAELQHFLKPTKLLPTDGIVAKTANEITAGAKTDMEKAHAIYEWIVENTFRNPKTRGCGTGDIRFMLETKDLSGKCADLNALYRS